MEKYKHISYFMLCGAAFLFSVHVSNAFLGNSDLLDKQRRLEGDYEAQIEIINRVNEVIEKQYDIKENAERTLRSVTLELSTVKAQLEMEKEEPDLSEVRRLSTKAAEQSAELGLSTGLHQ